MTVKLLTEHHLELLSLTGGCRGSYESTLIKMPLCWKSRVTAHFKNVPPVLLNFLHFLNLLQKVDTMLWKPRILSFFPN